MNRRAKGDDPDRCNTCNTTPLGWCSRCQREGPITRRRSENPLCLKCVLIERVDALLATHDDPIARPLATLREVLLGGPNAATTLQWLARGGGAKLLIELSHSDSLSHQVLNELPGSDRSRDYLRSLLVACGALPPWNLDVERLTSYINGLAEGLNTDEDRQLFMAFARWQVLRRFRHKAEQCPGVLSPGYSRAVVRTAARFLTLLRSDSRGMSQCHQADIDHFVSSSVTTARYLRPFIVWAIKNRTVIGIEPSPLRHGVGSASADPMEHWVLARKFLHDDSLDLADRVAGALVVIYAQPVTRVARLSREQLSKSDGVLYLKLGNEPLAIPEPLAGLLLQLPHRRQDMMGTRLAPTWLFPGRIAGRSVDPESVRKRLGKLGVECRSQRAAALLQMASELPSAVISDLLGVDPSTAEHWVRYAGGTWGRYAAERGLPDRLARPN